ncbi:TonB-dependent receptor family protein [Pseudomonas cichorii]|uniref:Membrane protein n=1 Tax=Pseudomonas cichorii TaxID=36746 RepID=A0ABQ1DSE2_PSECI|nr:TonB-dependent receptor [Pseudomonas cichorii]AHF67842.1 putative tonB-dependent receptor [Pseudomonas cichorii JBC1]QVE14924.1 TonB-dependent receptor [Pseudomonas cichorii]GFM93956.1 membrane protein [Pseudomonas cichorii]SDO91613.1 iron complex outermembrane recepter protein [Pseudomonas cichorii]
MHLQHTPPFPLSRLSTAKLLGLSTALACVNIAHAQSSDENTVNLSNIEVSAGTVSAAEVSREEVKKVPGATNVVDLNDVEQGRVANNEDVFKYQAGIYAKAANNEGAKISIRGSGINRAPGAHASGLFEMLDGLPLTGPGGTPYELKEPLWLSHVDVRRGANGFDQGSLALGGSINYLTRTGYDAPKLQLRYEAGSHGYTKRQISSGQVLGDLDYYVSLTDSNYDGFQDQSSGGSKGIAANVGYRFNPNIETRFYFRYRETDNDTPGRLTKNQIQHDPRAANSLNVTRDSKRLQPGSTWLANKTTFYLDDNSRVEAGLVYHDYPMDLREGTNRLKVAYTDISGTLNYIRQDQLAGHQSITTLGLRTTKGLPNNGASEYVRIPTGNTAGFAVGTKTRDYSYLGSDTALHLSNDLELVPDLWLTTGVAAIYTRRETEVTYPEVNDPVSTHDWDYAARLGLRYDFTPQLQVYGNLSRSVEPPHAWSMIWGSNKFFPAGSGAATGLQRAGVELENQTATTLELGGRGENGLGRWDLAWYYSQVRHELLSVETQAATQTTSQIIAESNASPTIHQGIEASLDSTLWQGGAAGKLALRQAYTYSDFHYRDDDRFGDNQLAGIPKHYYQAELRYSHPTSFYVGLNTEHASKIAVDYANSYYADSYTLLGATLGYASPKDDWQTWLDLRNLTNKRYASTVTPGYDDRGQDVARSTPGDGLGVYAGISWSLR